MRRAETPALLITDPVNILYATGAQNMSIWAMRNTSRYLLLFAEGPVILFEPFGCEHLSQGLPTLDEVRPGIGVQYTSAGPGIEAAARRWASEIAPLVQASAGLGALVGVDRLPFAALDALRAAGLRLTDADAVVYEARRLKLSEELPYIEEAVNRVEAAAADLAQSIEPGMSEAEVWAEFQRGFIARGGQYISTRLIAGGPRSFPYFQECSARPLQAGELLCFDTDAIGYLGYAVDFSRTFLCGGARGGDAQRKLYGLARDQLAWNAELFQPGRSYREIAERTWPIPEAYRPTSYYCIAHGLGMSGEYPNVPHLQAGEAYPMEGVVEPGMVICVESYIGSAQAGQGVKLEDQFLITETGPKTLSRFPFEERLLGREL